MTELSKTNKILIFCKIKRSFREIKKEIGWSDGTTYNVLRQLRDRGLVDRNEIGVYHTTHAGLKYLQEKTDELEDIESKRIDTIVYESYFKRGVLPKTGPPLSLLIGIRDVLYKDVRTKRICENIKEIYVNSVHNHFADDLLIISMWADHTQHRCERHDFDFDASYEKHATDETREIDKEGLFRSLHRYSRIVLSLDKYWIKKK